MRTDFRYKQASLAMWIGFGIAIGSGAAQTDTTPPQELIRYIRETKSQGFADAKIKNQAMAVGWPAAKVDEALAYVHNEKPSSPATGQSKTAESSTPQPAPQHLTAAPEAAAPKQPPASQSASSSRGVPDDYQIGSGDTLQISVWKQEELSVPTALVRSDGKITVPLAKEIEVVGLTPTQVEQKIADKLKEYITDPIVTVVVATNTSKKIYVIGAARKEGPLPYTYGMTVLQALSEAGGLTDYAKRKSIKILHSENGQQYQFSFNYDAVTKGENMDQNITLFPGDTIVIPH
jgi:polysaccharide biosynthesis/export protein